MTCRVLPLEEIWGKDYLVNVANSPHFTSAKLRMIKKGEQYLTPDCGEYLAVGRCKNGHRWGKQLYCGREWCHTCNEIMNKRRVARWLPKAQQIKSMGYIVITFPKEMRPLLRRQVALRHVGKRAARILKDMGYSRGLRRWHWFGDKSENYHPHLNIIIDGEYLPPAINKKHPEPGTLEYLKKRLRNGLIPKSLRRHIPYYMSQHIHYTYTNQPHGRGGMYSKLKYVARSTFKNYEWDKDMALTLRGFRNITWWGHWAGAPVWSMERKNCEFEHILDLVQKKCPKCGESLNWTVPDNQFWAWFMAKDVGLGYWSLPDHKPRDHVINNNGGLK